MLLAGGQGTRHKNLEGPPGPASRASLGREQPGSHGRARSYRCGSGGPQRSMVRFPEMIPRIVVQSLHLYVHFPRENSVSFGGFSKWSRTHSQGGKEEAEKIESNIFAKADKIYSLFLFVRLV